jgi:hypothetical protein
MMHMWICFFPLALEHAWKVFATLPHSALTTEAGETQSPYLVYFNRPASIADFKVLFCPVVMNYDNVFVSNPCQMMINARNHDLKYSIARTIRNEECGVST